MIQEKDVKTVLSKWSWFFGIIMFSFVVLLTGCGRKSVAAAPPPPPPPPATPTALLAATPARIEAGQSSTLTWQTDNATDITLEGESVNGTGTRTVTPVDSTTYLLIAKGPGGKQEAAVRITVTQPQTPPPAPTMSDEELFGQNIRNIYFDYDKYDVRQDQQAALEQNANWLAQHPNVSLVIEGHCDERGSIEYNLALGDSRANTVKTALIQSGIAPDRVHTTSYGKEKPFCTEGNEACWQQNRQSHLVYQR